MTNKNNSIYLENLEFDEKLNKSWMTFFIDRTRFTWLIIIVIIISGIFGLRKLPLESTPEVDIGMAVVTAVLPGASPESVEDLVTSKLEKEIGKVEGVNSITSQSVTSVSSILVQFKSNVNTKDTMRDLRDKVDSAKSNLPTDVNAPTVTEISLNDTPVWTFSISGNYDGFQLYNYSNSIKKELEGNPLVSEIKISGGEEKEFGVAIDSKKLEQYDLSIGAVNSAIQAVNTTIPIGNIEVENYVHSISVDSRFYDISKLQNIIVKKVGDIGIVYLKDIAEVKEVPKKITSISRLSIAGKKPLSAVTLSVTKKRGGSIVDLIDEGQKMIQDMRVRGVLPEDLYITNVLDYGEKIRNDLEHLVRDGVITILLVFVLLSIIIGTREALVAGTAVPLVFLVTFSIMSVYGLTLNFLSMFSLILALGLLVDDAIVIISAMNQYKRTGKFTTRESALLVIRDYKKVLLTTTLTVVWIFGSMLLMTGIVGKFVFSIPFVMCVTLLASLVIALTINPALATMIGGRNKKMNLSGVVGKTGFFAKLKNAYEHGFVSMSNIEGKYGRIMEYLFGKRRRRVLLFFGITILFLFSISLPITGVLKTDFFPTGDADNFSITIETEAGTKLLTTSEIAKQVEEYLYKEQFIKNFSTSVGTSGQGGGFGSSSNSENYASISVGLVKKNDGRTKTSMDIVDGLRKEFANIKDAKVTVTEESSGPGGGGGAFELSVAGEDFITLEKVAKDVTNVLATIPGAIDIKTTRKPLPFEFDLVFDNTRLALYDVSVPQVAAFLRNTIDGIEATKIYKGDDEIIVKTRFKADSVDTLDKIKDLKIRNNDGNFIALRDIMSTEFKPSVFSISRQDQERVITITAAASKNTNGTLIKQEFDSKTKDYKLPTGYKFVTGGMNEMMNDSMKSLFSSMIFGMIFIAATLILLYDSFLQTILVMVTIPLSLIGVFPGLTLFGQPLSFPGMIGMVALFGIVVRNGIILFDKINHNLAEKIPFKEAIIDAGMSRLEPVMLTSICTALGMIPLTLSNPIWTSLGLSIICGLTVSTIFTLVVLPSLYFVVFGKGDRSLKLKVES